MTFSRFCISSFVNYTLYHCEACFDVWLYVMHFFRPACILRVTWMTASSCSAASTRSPALLGSSATPPSSSPTLSSNHMIIHHTVVLGQAADCSFISALYPLRALDSIAERGSAEVASFVEDVLQTLNDLIEYFKQPDSELEHEKKQCLLRSLIKRQDLFKEEVRAELELLWAPVHLCFFLCAV